MKQSFDRTFTRSDVDRYVRAVHELQDAEWALESEWVRENLKRPTPMHILPRASFDRLVKLTGCRPYKTAPRTEGGAGADVAEFGGVLFYATGPDPQVERRVC